LRSDRQPPIAWTEASIVTVDTATYGHGAIPVRAGETSVDGDFVDTAAKYMAQMISKRHITLTEDRGVQWHDRTFLPSNGTNAAHMLWSIAGHLVLEFATQ
jgi:hypothetical protein